jgi:DNA-binding MarR family transcriptional regulator
MVRHRSTVKAQPGLFLQPFVVSQLVAEVVDHVIEGSGLVGSEYAVASWLNSIGGATPSELARQLGLSATTLSAIIERLVRKNEVRRVRNADDGRSYVLEPTEQGRDTYRYCGRRLLKARDRLSANLEGEPEDVLAALRLLEDALRKTSAEDLRTLLAEE